MKAGYVYIISNIGAFGENVYKIGMTRRLDPQERVDELGDASVPFNFDVHAMIFSDDAPALEAALHKAFENRKLNMVNKRREFFNVTLDEIKESGEINIGVFSDKNPFGYVDDNGDYQGYDVYFAERLGKDLGVKINYVSTEAANRVEYLETGKVDVVLANFTVTDERAEKVDFALPYMNVALGVVSHEDRVITSLDQIGADDQVIVISGTTAETYLEQNEPDIKLQKFDTYAAAKTAFENGTGVAWANDNTEVIAYAKENPGYVVGISSLGDQQSIAPAVTKGNSTLLDWINAEIESLGEENFFHADYEATLLDTYGADYEDTLVIEGGATK